VCDTVGRDVRVDLPDGTVLAGRAAGVDTEGRLEVATATGKSVVLGAGDVVHVRPRA
jgi:BirA family biotin operon repressor/biotin-[acetyl-CoA-carboxylase] ligase